MFMYVIPSIVFVLLAVKQFTCVEANCYSNSDVILCFLPRKTCMLTVKTVTSSWNAELYKTSQTERQIFTFL